MFTVSEKSVSLNAIGVQRITVLAPETENGECGPARQFTVTISRPGVVAVDKEHFKLCNSRIAKTGRAPLNCHYPPSETITANRIEPGIGIQPVSITISEDNGGPEDVMVLDVTESAAAKVVVTNPPAKLPTGPAPIPVVVVPPVEPRKPTPENHPQGFDNLTGVAPTPTAAEKKAKGEPVPNPPHK